MSYFSTVLADNPIAAYRLGESSGTVAADSSSSGLNGTYNGSVGLAQKGALTGDPNTAVSFNNNSNVTIPWNAAFNLTTGLSVECWFQVAALPGPSATYQLVARGQFLLRIDSSTEGNHVSGFIVIQGGGEPRCSTLTAPTVGAWHHVVLTWNGATLAIYLDGVLQSTVSRQGPADSDTTTTLQLGNTEIGLLDEVALYNHALNAVQVSAHYKAGLAQVSTHLLLQNGNDVTLYFMQENWVIRQRLSRQGTTFTLHMVSESYVPVNELDQFTLIDTNLGATLFDGLVTEAELSLPGPVLFDWRLVCTDWTYWLDRRHVTSTYGSQRTDQIITNLLTNFPCGITINNVQQGPLFQTFTIHHMSLSRALTRVAQFASTPSSNWSWYVDVNKDLHFFDMAQAASAAWYLSDSLVDSNPQRVLYDRPNFRYSIVANDIRTNAVIRGGVVTSNVETDRWVGNASETSWQLTYVPYTNSQASDYFAPTLTVAGVSQTVAFDTGASGQSAQFLISPSRIGGYSLIVNTGSTPANGAAIVLQYKYQLPVLQTVTHVGAQNKYKNKGGSTHDGKYDIVIEDPNITDAITAIQRGQHQLQGYAYAERRITVTTTPSDIANVLQPNHHFVAGTLVNVTNSQMVPALSSMPYIIYQNQIQGVKGGFRQYHMELVQVTGS